MKLWPFQDTTVEKLRDAIRQGYRRILLQAGTGSGKTVMMSHMMAEAQRKEKQVLFLAHRRELIHQCADKLKRFGLDNVGIIMAGCRPLDWARVQVASIQTLWRRRDRMKLPHADLLIIDEAHHATAKTYRALIEEYPDAISLGMTATPARKDGQGLGHIYDHMVQAPSISELTPDYLVPLKYVAPSQPDLEDLHIRMGDYIERELDAKMNKVKLIGDIIEHWLEFAPDRQTLVFASSVKHSINIAEKFQEAGIDAAHIDGNTPIDERDFIFERFRSGNITVLSNCMVCTEGTDLPMCSAVVLARPTKSLVLYFQMVGRVMRIFEDKQDGLVIDHSGSVYEHGFVDDPQPWSLEDGKIQERQAKKKERKAKPITCPECSTMFEGRRSCPGCGWEPELKGIEIKEMDGKLVFVHRNGFNSARMPDRDEQIDFYRGLLAVAEDRDYKPGWVAWTWKEKYGFWPPRAWQRFEPVVPNLMVVNHVRKKAREYARSRANARASTGSAMGQS